MEAYQKYAEGTFYFSIIQCNGTHRKKWSAEFVASSSFPVLCLLKPVMGITKWNPSIISEVF
jgi:hypothetical protein